MTDMSDDEIVHQLAAVRPGSLDDTFALLVLRGTYPHPEAREHWLREVSRGAVSRKCFTEAEV